MSLADDFLIDEVVYSVNSGLNIVKVLNQAEKPTGCKHTPNLLAHVRRDDLSILCLNLANRFQNDAQALTRNMVKHRKIEHKPSRTFGYRTVKQFMQLVCRHFIEIAPRPNNQRTVPGFGLYAHV